MKSLILALVVACSLLAQNPNSAVFPGASAADTDLFVANNDLYGTLNGSITSGATSIVLTVTGGTVVAPLILTVESEIVHCTTWTSGTSTLSGCTRGKQGTTAASHSSGAGWEGYITAWHYNQSAAEIKAIESALLSHTLGYVTGSANLTTTNAVPKQSGTTGDLTQSGVTIDSSNDVTTPGALQTGSGAAYSGTNYFLGKTSGGLGFTVADVAGLTALFQLPQSAPSSGQVLAYSGTTGCPTLPTLSPALPSTCYQLAWQAGAGGGAGNYPVAQNFKPLFIGGGEAQVSFGSSISNGACSTNTMTFNGAQFSDKIAVERPASLADGYVVTAWVSAANTIKFEVCNMTGSSATPGTLNLGVAVIRTLN